MLVLGQFTYCKVVRQEDKYLSIIKYYSVCIGNLYDVYLYM